jgi:hypothetical protein
LEVKINREIRAYTESMFFGLSLRQLIFSILSVGVAIGLYFGLRTHFGMETLSWMCILGAAPFAALGFVTWHGMTAEKFLWAYLKSEILMPKRLTFHADNIYYEAVKPAIEHPNASGMVNKKLPLDIVMSRLSAVLAARKEHHHD